MQSDHSSIEGNSLQGATTPRTSVGDVAPVIALIASGSTTLTSSPAGSMPTPPRIVRGANVRTLELPDVVDPRDKFKMLLASSPGSDIAALVCGACGSSHSY